MGERYSVGDSSDSRLVSTTGSPRDDLRFWGRDEPSAGVVEPDPGPGLSHLGSRGASLAPHRLVRSRPVPHPPYSLWTTLAVLGLMPSLPPAVPWCGALPGSPLVLPPTSLGSFARPGARFLCGAGSIRSSSHRGPRLLPGAPPTWLWLSCLSASALGPSASCCPSDPGRRRFPGPGRPWNRPPQVQARRRPGDSARDTLGSPAAALFERRMCDRSP